MVYFEYHQNLFPHFQCIHMSIMNLLVELNKSCRSAENGIKTSFFFTTSYGVINYIKWKIKILVRKASMMNNCNLHHHELIDSIELIVKTYRKLDLEYLVYSILCFI